MVKSRIVSMASDVKSCRWRLIKSEVLAFLRGWTDVGAISFFADIDVPPKVEFRILNKSTPLPAAGFDKVCEPLSSTQAVIINERKHDSFFIR